MKKYFTAYLLIVLFAVGLACSPSEDEPVATPPSEPVTVDEIAGDPEVGPPLITTMPPQPPGPAPEIVEQLPQPTFRKPKIDPNNMSMTDARAKAQFYVADTRNPIVNGNFERWEKPGPIHWDGNFTYKNPGDPPDMDIQMYPMLLDGEWALRFMTKGTYIELWQDVKLPEIEGGLVIEATAYVLNPVQEGFAIRIVYVAGSVPQVAEVYPDQADEKWTRYHARIELPANVGHKSVRLYLTRDVGIGRDVIIDGVSVRVVGATGASAAPPSRTN